MMRLGVDICGLSEVRWNGQGHFTTLDGHTIVYSGRLTFAVLTSVNHMIHVLTEPNF